MQACTVCAAPVRPGARFCTACGAPVSAVMPSSPPVEPLAVTDIAVTDAQPEPVEHVVRIVFTWSIRLVGGLRMQRLLEALAAALGLPFESLTITTRAPWRWLAPRLLFGAHEAFGERFAQRLQQPLPSPKTGQIPSVRHLCLPFLQAAERYV